MDFVNNVPLHSRWHPGQDDTESKQDKRAADGQHSLVHTPSIAFRHLPPNSAGFSYATEGALFISAHLSTDAVSALRRFGSKLQALVYDILPSTTAVFSYAIGSRKLLANEQFFCWC